MAADTASLKWAAAQAPNQIYVFEGQELVKKLRLPPAKRFYRQGLLSFAPASTVVVAARPADEQVGEVWFLQYGVENDNLTNLFPWEKEPILDFVVGPRMFWDRHDKKDYKSVH